MRCNAHRDSPSLSSFFTSLMTSTASQQTPARPREGVRFGRRQAAASLRRTLLGSGVGDLGLLGPKQRSHLADLPVDAGAGGATQGSILLHAVPVVPHLAHVAREQVAGERKMG